MISIYDFLIIALYLAFLASIGWIFKRFTKGSTDYFAGGFRMTWWLVGAGSFVSNFSCWTFTGAAHMAYTYGVLIFGFFLMDAFAFLISWLWFAPRLRQLRLVTAMDAVRLRFGRASEQFFTWLNFINSLGVAAVWLIGLSVILSSSFQLPAIPVIVATGVVVIAVALVGGSWAVAASDFVQLIVLLGVTIVISALTLVKVGGVGAFVAQIPESHWQLFHPAGSMPYDWLYLVTGYIAAVYTRNNLVNAGKYITARDSIHARRSALVPFFGYIFMPIVWMIPPLAAFTLVPDLASRTFMTSPGEASYIAVCLTILPQGLIGLVIVCMFSATMSSMDVALNKNAGFFVRNFYAPILRPRARDGELLLAGRLSTVLFGLLVTGAALLTVTRSRVSLFDAYLYLAAYLGVPLAIPLFFGMLIRGVPRWAGWAAALFGMGLTAVLYLFAPTESGRTCFVPIVGETVYAYMLSNKFVVTNIVGAPFTALFFWGTSLFHRVGTDPDQEKRTDEFFRRLETPIDFEREVGNDNTASQARVIGRLTLAFGVFIAAMMLIPNPLSARLAVLSCAIVPLVVGAALIRYAKKRQSGDGAIAAPAKPWPPSQCNAD
jgi:Na+/proline symporter